MRSTVGRYWWQPLAFSPTLACNLHCIKNEVSSGFGHIYRSSHQKCSMKKTVLRNSLKFLNSLRPATLLKKRPWHRCFPVNFKKFLRTPFLQNTTGRLLLHLLKKSLMVNFKSCTALVSDKVAILDWIWRDTEYLTVFSPNAWKCEKNVDQNNSEYGHFLRSAKDKEMRYLWINFSMNLFSLLFPWVLYEKISLLVRHNKGCGFCVSKKLAQLIRK